MSHLNLPVRVVVTRPEREATPWVQALCEQGVQARAFPLIAIAPLGAEDGAAVLAAWHRLSERTAVMFVSANAVRHFCSVRPSGIDLVQVQAWGTGPGTRAALQEAGWPVSAIRCPDESAPQFDSEALWDLVQPDVLAAVHGAKGAGAAPSVLIVRGGDAQGQMAGRDWLAQQIIASGMSLAQCVAYARQAPVWDDNTQAQALQALYDGHWWLFSSSEAAVHLCEILPHAALAQAQALATHPRIAERLLQMGWGRVVMVPAALSAQIESIKSDL